LPNTLSISAGPSISAADADDEDADDDDDDDPSLEVVSPPRLFPFLLLLLLLLEVLEVLEVLVVVLRDRARRICCWRSWAPRHAKTLSTIATRTRMAYPTEV
jgi:hypothetical protein